MSVHRPHTIIGYAVGDAMNMGVTLAATPRSARRPAGHSCFRDQRRSGTELTDVTDAMLLARHLEWPATTAAARDQAFNVVNGEVSTPIWVARSR